MLTTALRAVPRRLVPGGQGVTLRALPAVLLLVTLAACATVAPGHDPIVVNAERALRAADAIYAESMAYYFRPGVVPTLGNDAIKVFEAVRTGFDAPYKAVQGALGAYKAIRTPAAAAELKARTTELAAVLNPAVQLTPGALKPLEVK